MASPPALATLPVSRLLGLQDEHSRFLILNAWPRSVFRCGLREPILDGLNIWGCSSNDRAIALHAIGSGIDAHHLQLPNSLASFCDEACASK